MRTIATPLVRTSFIIGLIFTSVFICKAQPDIQWQRALGGSFPDGAYDVFQTADGGYVMAGFAESNDGDVSQTNGYNDFWIVKLDNNGTLEWEKTYGGFDDDVALSIQQTTDGGYIVAGYTASNDFDVSDNQGGYDYWIIKLNATGDLEWEKSFGGSLADHAHDVKQTSDGGYIVAGVIHSHDGDITTSHAASEFWVLKLDAIGNLVWQKAYGGSGTEAAHAVDLTSDGGYIIAGSSSSNDGDVTGNHGNLDYWIIKINSIGDMLWQKSYGGSESDEARSIEQTTDGGYIISGFSNSNDGDVIGLDEPSDYWIIKTDGTGNLVWQSTIGGSEEEGAVSIVQTMDGGYLATGTTGSDDGDVSDNNGARDYWVTKLTSSGSLDWEKNLGGSLIDFAFSIIENPDGSIVVAGYAESNDGDVTGNHGSIDAWIVKLADGLPNNPCSGHKVAICHNGHTICVDQHAVPAHMAHGDYLGACVENIAFPQHDNLNDHVIHVSPNPSQGSFTIHLEHVENLDDAQLKFLDLHGKVLQSITLDQRTKFEFHDADEGIFFIQYVTPDFISTEKIIILK